MNILTSFSLNSNTWFQIGRHESTGKTSISKAWQNQEWLNFITWQKTNLKRNRTASFATKLRKKSQKRNSGIFKTKTNRDVRYWNYVRTLHVITEYLGTGVLRIYGKKKNPRTLPYELMKKKIMSGTLVGIQWIFHHQHSNRFFRGKNNALSDLKTI